MPAFGFAKERSATLADEKRASPSSSPHLTSLKLHRICLSQTLKGTMPVVYVMGELAEVGFFSPQSMFILSLHSSFATTTNYSLLP